MSTNNNFFKTKISTLFILFNGIINLFNYQYFYDDDSSIDKLLKDSPTFIQFIKDCWNFKNFYLFKIN